MVTANLGTILILSVICSLGLVEISNSACPFASMHIPRKPSTQSCNGLSNITCDATSKYRTYDGSCNNLLHPSWGSNDSRYERLMPAKYGDVFCRYLLSTISQKWKQFAQRQRIHFSIDFYIDVHVDSTIATLFVQQFGQFIAHDMSSAKNTSKTAITDCCSSGTDSLERCYPIFVPENDPLYTPNNITCLNFSRTLTDKNMNCSGKWNVADQISEINAYLDLSVVYGNDDETNAELRSYSNGLLIVEERHDQDWFPANPNPAQTCKLNNANDSCYLAGDFRVNQNPQLTTIQLMFLREHNRVATKISKINSHWNDEKVFQESRRIVIAEFQNIVYNYWLPVILGNDTVQSKNLTYFGATGYVDDYNDTINAGILAEHAQGAYRYFHTNIQGWLDLDTDNRTTTSTARLSDWLFNPTILEIGEGADNLLRGLSTQAQSESDRYFTREITWYFVRRWNGSVGQDLRAMDIQRGRDHGLPTYNDARAFFGLPRATAFENFTDVMSSENAALLESLYESPDDVDLTVGGSLETVSTGMAGRTFLEIIAIQFERTRKGDRFFYENSRNSEFTLAQLNQIRKATMARILCDNGHNITTIQPDVFRLISENNALTSCDSIPEVDLNYWEDTSDDNTTTA